MEVKNEIDSVDLPNSLLDMFKLKNPVPVHNVTEHGYVIEYIISNIKFYTTIPDNMVQKVYPKSLDCYLTQQEIDTLLDIAEQVEVLQATKDVKDTTVQPMTIKRNKQFLQQLVGNHRTHYVKLVVEGALSLRYFYEFQDRPYMEGSWWMWNHQDKTHVMVSSSVVETLLPSVGCITEVIGMRRGKKYQKIIKNLETGEINLGK